jgi:hypothetical protein
MIRKELKYNGATDWEATQVTDIIAKLFDWYSKDTGKSIRAHIWFGDEFSKGEFTPDDLYGKIKDSLARRRMMDKCHYNERSDCV